MVANVVVACGDLGPPVENRTDVAFELALDVIAGAVTSLRDAAALVNAAQVLVKAIARLVGVVGTKAITYGVADRSRKSAFNEGLLETVIAGADLGLEVVGGALGDIVDRAAVGVATEQGVLRTAQNLDLVDEERGVLQDGGGVGAIINTVNIDGDAGFDRQIVGVATDAAHVRAIIVGGVVQARREVGHVLNRRYALQVERFGGERGDGGRYPLEVLRAFLRRDDDLRQARVVHRRFRGRLCGHRRAGVQDCQHGKAERGRTA